MLEFIISPNLLHAGKPAIWYLSAYDAPRRRNIFRAVDSPSCRGNLFDYEGTWCNRDTKAQIITQRGLSPLCIYCAEGRR